MDVVLRGRQHAMWGVRGGGDAAEPAAMESRLYLLNEPFGRGLIAWLVRGGNKKGDDVLPGRCRRQVEVLPELQGLRRHGQPGL